MNANYVLSLCGRYVRVKRRIDSIQLQLVLNYSVCRILVNQLLSAIQWSFLLFFFYYSAQGKTCCAGSYWDKAMMSCESKF